MAGKVVNSNFLLLSKFVPIRQESASKTAQAIYAKRWQAFETNQETVLQTTNISLFLRNDKDKMTYEFSKNPPKPIEDNDYVKKANEEFRSLLENCPEDETKFQNFFELNPSFMPGARDEFSIMGQSGHEPYGNCLISQPKISGIINRIPDFMWLASDSVYFTPVIIEIEAPSKKYFKKKWKPNKSFFTSKKSIGGMANDIKKT